MIFWNCRDNFENKVERAIWHYLKLVLLQRQFLKTMSLKHAFWLYLKRFWNCREHFINTFFKASALDGIWNDLKLQKNYWNNKACILAVFETIWNRRKKYENKDPNACKVTRFDAIFWLAEQILKAMKLNGAFWRFLRLMLEHFYGIR